jgi:hypothetical protein
MLRMGKIGALTFHDGKEKTSESGGQRIGGL